MHRRADSPDGPPGPARSAIHGQPLAATPRRARERGRSSGHDARAAAGLPSRARGRRVRSPLIPPPPVCADRRPGTRRRFVLHVMVEITSPPLPPPGRDNVEITSSTASWRAGGFAVKKKSATPQQPSDTMQMTDVPLSDQPPARARAQSSGLQGDISEHQPKFGEAIPWWKVVVAQLCYLLLTLLYVLLFSAAFSAGPYVFNALNVETWVSRLLWGASLGLLLLLYVFDFSYWPGSAGRWARRVGVGLVLLGVVLGGLLLSSAYPAFPMGMYLLCLPLFSLFLRGSLFARHGTGDVLRVLSVVFAVAGGSPPPRRRRCRRAATTATSTTTTSQASSCSCAGSRGAPPRHAPSGTTTKSSKRGTASWAAATTRVRGPLTRAVAAAQDLSHPAATLRRRRPACLMRRAAARRVVLRGDLPAQRHTRGVVGRRAAADADRRGARDGARGGGDGAARLQRQAGGRRRDRRAVDVPGTLGPPHMAATRQTHPASPQQATHLTHLHRTTHLTHLHRTSAGGLHDPLEPADARDGVPLLGGRARLPRQQPGQGALAPDRRQGDAADATLTARRPPLTAHRSC